MSQLKIFNRNELATVLQQLKSEGNVIVTTNGCFDVLHLGHLRYLQAARQLGDLLVVAINSDASVRELKGENRPLIPEDERAEMLAGLECVDYVVIFPELNPIELLSELKPTFTLKVATINWSSWSKGRSLRQTEARLSLDSTYRVNLLQTL